MNDHKIERNDGHGFGRQQLLANSIENCISNKKKWLVAGRYLQSINTFLTVELSHYRKSGSTFSSSEPVAARSDCCRLGKPCRPSNPPKLRLSAAWLTPGPVTGHLSGRVPDRVCSFIPGLAWAPYATHSVVAKWLSASRMGATKGIYFGSRCSSRHYSAAVAMRMSQVLNIALKKFGMYCCYYCAWRNCT